MPPMFMPVTQQVLSDFNQFAVEKLSNGGADTLQELLDEWNAGREHDASVASIRESIAQYEAGEGLPAKEAFADIRRRLGWIK